MRGRTSGAAVSARKIEIAAAPRNWRAGSTRQRHRDYLPEHDTRMSDAMIGQRICREAVTTPRLESRIRVQSETGTHAVGAEHGLIAQHRAVLIAHEIHEVVS